MRISPAASDDLSAATDCMVAAFLSDPLAVVFFADSPLGHAATASRFFGLLLEARIALKMPVLVARVEDAVVGVAMGDDAAPPDWPPSFQQRLNDIQTAHPPLAARFEIYERIAKAAGPDIPCYNLGLLAVSPAFQGKGIGKALIGAFLDLSDGDPKSQGTSLETASPANLGLYARHGFEMRCSGAVEQATIWCMFRPKNAPVTV